MKRAIVFYLLTLAGVNLAASSDPPCPKNEIFRRHGGPACENCGPRCLVFISAAKCYCKTGYSRVNGNCIPNEECSSPPNKLSGPSQITPRTAMENLGMYEGDMLGVNLDADRNAVPYDSQLWPGGVIPYVFDNALPGVERTGTIKGMKHIEATTCIRFVPRTYEYDYIRVIYGDGCYSYWGRTTGEQPVSIGYKCDDVGTTIHELLHAVGFQHEHMRSDRDDYITIYWNNIDPKMLHNFEKFRPLENRLLTPFDYNSIMLYGSTAFAKSWNTYSMVRKDGQILPEVYNKYSMSPSDIKRVKLLYHCRN